MSKSQKTELTKRNMPSRTRGYQQEAEIGGTKVVVETREFANGELAEFQIRSGKDSTNSSYLSHLATAVSIGLRYGVPLEEFVDEYIFTRFEPSGMVTGNSSIKMATSIPDYVFRELAIAYLGRTDLSHVTNQSDEDDSRNYYDEDTAEEGKISRIRLSKSKEEIFIVTSSMIDQISHQISELKSSMPNDEENHQNYISQIEFLEDITKELIDLLDIVEILITEERVEIRREASNLITEIKNKIENWSKNNKEIMEDSVRMTLSSVFLGLLSYSGAEMTLGTAAVLGTFGGKRLVESVKKLMHKDKGTD